MKIIFGAIVAIIAYFIYKDLKGKPGSVSMQASSPTSNSVASELLRMDIPSSNPSRGYVPVLSPMATDYYQNYSQVG